ncbi:MAG: c-type cytochrome [Pseudomonadota bacterium]
MIAALTGAAAVVAFLVYELPRLREARQIALGRSVYAVNCAQCHGRKLEGQPDWRTPLANGRLPAPPHDASGHTWHHSDEMLFNITRNGLKPYAGENYESDMPAFAGVLKDEEITAAIAFIRSTWPEREHAYQRQVTLQQTKRAGPK